MVSRQTRAFRNHWPVLLLPVALLTGCCLSGKHQDDCAGTCCVQPAAEPRLEPIPEVHLIPAHPQPEPASDPEPPEPRLAESPQGVQPPPPPLPEEAPAVVPVSAVKRELPEFGNAGNYEWLLGVLQRVHAPGGEWKIRYAPISKEDRWGGSMVLAPDIRLEQFEEGQRVFVRGEIIVERPSLYVSGPQYRLRSIEPAEEIDFADATGGSR